MKPPQSQPLVDSQWLVDHLTDPEVAIVDVRPPPFYLQGHIPRAVNLPIFLLGADADAATLADRLSNLAVTREHHVVAYDDGASPNAATLYRLLTYYRHPRVSVLDGGMTKWLHEGRDSDHRPADPGYAPYEIGEADEPTRASTEDVLRAIGAPDAAIVDVRSPAEYLGLQATAARDGHIPGAVNIDWTNNLISDRAGLTIHRADAELRQLYEAAGVTPDKLVFVYCQTANRTSETFLVLRKLGYPRVKAYVPGWQEWSNRTDTPVEVE